MAEAQALAAATAGTRGVLWDALLHRQQVFGGFVVEVLAVFVGGEGGVSG